MLIMIMIKYIYGEVEDLSGGKCSVILLVQKGDYLYQLPLQDRDFTVKKCA